MLQQTSSPPPPLPPKRVKEEEEVERKRKGRRRRRGEGVENQWGGGWHKRLRAPHPASHQRSKASLQSNASFLEAMLSWTVRGMNGLADAACSGNPITSVVIEKTLGDDDAFSRLFPSFPLSLSAFSSLRSSF